MPSSLPPQHRQPPGRKTLFFAATVAVPILLLLCIELLLRVIHYGPDLSLFMKVQAAGKEYLAMNPAVKARYFFRTDFSPGASPDAFLLRKPDHGIRIFCLGASTTVGYPYWYNAAFPAFLRSELEHTFPERQVEVINLGMTATNSFTVLDMARDVVRMQPDAVVVYDGHNEFYGAFGVASRESLGRSRWMVNAYLKLLHTRTFLLLRDAIGLVAGWFSHGGPEEDSATVMERMAAGKTIPYGSGLYKTAEETFASNLADLKAICSDAGVPLVVCTQVSNLRDLPPFTSDEPRDLPAAALEQFRRSLAGGDSLLRAKDDARAAGEIARALAIDSLHAQSQYLLAKAELLSGQPGQARRHFVLARDYDPIRFRASSDFNAVILKIGPPAIPVDVEALFNGASPDGITGNTLITEHLHPTAYGHLLIAHAVAAAFADHGILASPAEWKQRDTVTLQRLWEERTVTPLDERIALRKTEILTSGWPFRAGTRVVSGVSPDDTLGTITEMLTRGRWDWRQAHEAAATYDYGRNDYGAVTDEMRTIALTNPLDAGMQKRWADAALMAGRRTEAIQALGRLLGLTQEASVAKQIGDLSLEKNDLAGAAVWYRKGLTLSTVPEEQADLHYVLALVNLKTGDANGTMDELRQVLRLSPGHAQARALLQQLERSHAPEGAR